MRLPNWRFPSKKNSGLSNSIFWTTLGFCVFALTARSEAVGATLKTENEGTVDGQNESTWQAPSPSWWFNQYSLLQGPSLTNPNPYQPDVRGDPDLSRPVALKNFSTVGWETPDRRGFAGTFSWAALAGEQAGLALRDPSIRAYDSALIESDVIDWYGDVRLHLGLGPESRLLGRDFSLQTFHSVSVRDRSFPFWAGVWASIKLNRYNSEGNVPLWEFYIAPNLHWASSSSLTFSLSVEENAGIWKDLSSPDYFSSDPWYAEASLEWQVSPSVEVSPSLSVPLEGSISLNSLSGSLGLSWTLQ
jgi:hypothetical protein